jgi:Heterokaryon incompatibility protein (HET)
LPRRLIDVGDPLKHISPRLVSSTGLETHPFRYATLSHCWGKLQPLQTNKATEEAYRSEIPLESLPKTFLDALFLSASLGIQYLWIDCLCIVQDDELDWQQQAAQMAAIYKGSSLTIAATDSPNSDGGCFLGQLPALLEGASSNSSRHSVPFIVHDLQSNVFILAIFETKLFNNKFFRDSVLNERAWVLQELALSSRVVHCSRDELCWQCNVRCEAESGTLYDISSFRDLPSIPKLHTRFQSDASQIWWLWVDNYTRRKLSISSDRLPAIAGITTHYKEMTDDTPMLGLWKRTLHYDLQWVIFAVRKNRQRNTGFPSWSWLSREAPVQLRFSYFFKPPDGKHTIDIAVEKWDVVWMAEPFTSAVRSFNLTINGPVVETLIILTPAMDTSLAMVKMALHPPSSPRRYSLRRRNLREELVPAICAFDDQDPEANVQQICLLLYTVIGQDERLEAFLILVKSPQKDDCHISYSRVGTGCIKTKTTECGLFDAAPRLVLNLI